MTPLDSRRVLALLNEALEITCAADSMHPQSEDDWKLQNDIRACRNMLAARLVSRLSVATSQREPVLCDANSGS